MKLGVAFMCGAVLTFDAKEKFLHLSEGTAFDCGGDFFNHAFELRLPNPQKAGDVITVSLGGERLPLRRDGHLKIANALE